MDKKTEHNRSLRSVKNHIILSRLLALILVLSHLNGSDAILKCFSPGMFRMGKVASNLNSGYLQPEIAAGYGALGSGSIARIPQYQSSLKAPWLNNNNNKYNGYSPEQQKTFELANPIAMKKSLLQSKWNNKGGLFRRKFGTNWGMLSPFHIPSGSSYQNYNSQMRPVFPGYNSAGYQVNGELNVAPFSIPSYYNPSGSNSNDVWKIPSYSSSANNQQQQQQIQINTYDSNKQSSNNASYQPANGGTKNPNLSNTTTKAPNNATNNTNKTNNNQQITTKKPKA